MRKKKGLIGAIILLIAVLMMGCAKKESEYDIVNMENYDMNQKYTVDDFPFQYPQKAKELAQLYKDMMNTPKEEFYGVKEKKNAYVQNLNKDGCMYLYYGKMKDGKPDGDGIIINEVSQYVEYIGGFKEGKKNGYGWDFEVIYGTSIPIVYLSYEGEFDKGKIVDGTSYIYTDYNENDYMQVESTIGNTKDLFFKSLYVRYKGTKKNGCVYEYESNIGNYKVYEGEIRGDKPHGKAIEYYPSGQIKYKGEFKNGKYNGEGVLYNEDGSIEYEGKFRNGEVK